MTRRSRPQESRCQGYQWCCGRCHGLAHVENITGAVEDPAWLRFQTITMYRSRCYTGSDEKLHCVTCHDPHKNAETAPAYYESKCLSCHSSGKPACPVNPANGCIACHMPKTWVQSTHAFKSDHNIRVHARRAAGP